jgi:CO/xanthine dehydrogenase Mo-binding subunit
MSDLPGDEADGKGGPDAPFGSPQKIFEAIEELACMAGIHAEQIRLHAATEDMTGVEYATRRLWAHMRALGGIVKDFKEHGHTLGPKGEF